MTEVMHCISYLVKLQYACMAFHSLAPGAMSGDVASPQLYIGNDRQADFVSRAIWSRLR